MIIQIKKNDKKIFNDFLNQFIDKAAAVTKSNFTGSSEWIDIYIIISFDLISDLIKIIHELLLKKKEFKIKSQHIEIKGWNIKNIGDLLKTILINEINIDNNTHQDGSIK